MAIRLPGGVVQDIRTLFDWGAMGTLKDGQLVARFLSGQDESEAAFRTLIHRHGPMVMGICRRVLGDEHAAEDAFQATFLVLVKKAGKLRDSDLLTNWLYGVALRVSRREKARAARRSFGQLTLTEDVTGPACELDRFELRSVIDEEIHRLPARYRVPLVLCHLEGMRHDEVAQRLGCPVGTIESRLSRARDQLRSRLTRRGLAPTELAIGAALRPPATATSLLSASTIDATIKAVGELSFRRAEVGTALVWSLLKRTSALATSVHTGTAVSILVICAGLTAMRLGPYLAGPELSRLAAATVKPKDASTQSLPGVLQRQKYLTRQPISESMWWHPRSRTRKHLSRSVSSPVQSDPRRRSRHRCTMSLLMAGSRIGPPIFRGTRFARNSLARRSTTQKRKTEPRILTPISWSGSIATTR